MKSMHSFSFPSTTSPSPSPFGPEDGYAEFPRSGPGYESSGSNNGGIIILAIAIIASLLLLFGILIGICICYYWNSWLLLINSCCLPVKKWKALVTDIYTVVTNNNNNNTTAAPPDLSMDQIWEGDAATMERFLHDMTNEKPIRFTSQQLSSFTNNCSDELGSGGFGVVYQGEFPNGVKIAVKVLNRSTDKRVKEQFMAEVATIGRTYHVNLVRLYGFCFDNGMCALVYEFMKNGSLDNILFKQNPGIECDQLYEIAIGTAKGLAYLHEECHQRIIHYDIKPENVLIDVNLSPKVADFGLAKLCSRNNSHASISGYRGTPGYSAPEFLLHNHPITHKCDVYSFGMLLFEIVRKRRNRDVGPTGSLDWFPKRVWEEYDQKGGLVEITSIECGIEEKDREKAERMFMVALWCVQDSPRARPSMSSVVRMLEGDVQVMQPPKPFQYLYSIGIANAPGMDSYSSTTGRTDESTCFKCFNIHQL